MKFRAIRKRVIARPLKREERESGGIIIPASDRNLKDKNIAQQFEIISVGPLAKAEYPDLVEGAHVFATKYAHTGEDMNRDNVYCLDADAIEAVVDGVATD